MGRLLLYTAVVLLKLGCICGISIEGLSGTKTAGGLETLRVVCRAGAADAARHNSLTLSRNLSRSYQNLATVAYDGGNAVTAWANEAGDFEARTRATATGTMTGGRSTLTVDVQDFDCSDAGIYRCSLNGLHGNFTLVQPTPTATATLGGIETSGNLTLQITEYQEPGDFYPRPIFENSEDYFGEDTVVTMDCEGDISKTTTGTGSDNENRIVWYSIRPGAFGWERYYPPNPQDITTRTIGGSSNSCLERVRSTLRYNVSYINDNDGTFFRCQTWSALSGESVSNLKIIFAGNSVDNTTVYPTSDYVEYTTDTVDYTTVHPTNSDVQCHDVYCISHQSYTNCKIQRDRRIVSVSLATEYTFSTCERCVNWGQENAYVWVKGGCSATFRVCTVAVSAVECDSFQCSSSNNVTSKCSVPGIGGGVFIVSAKEEEQLSTEPCTSCESYTSEDRYVYVRNGCSARFNVCFVRHDDTHQGWPSGKKPCHWEQ